MKPSTGKRVKETTKAKSDSLRASPRRIITPNAPGFPSHLSKWAFAIGTTSRVPGCPGWHYLMLDIDGELTWNPTGNEVIQQTKNGWHIYTRNKFTLPTMLDLAKRNGADPVWCSIAMKRGYAFLADKYPVELPWPVERMVIGK